MTTIENKEERQPPIGLRPKWIIDEMGWYAKKKHAEIVYKKCIKAKKYKWAMKIAYHYGLQDENKNDDTVMALGLALMSDRNSR